MKNILDMKRFIVAVLALATSILIIFGIYLVIVQSQTGGDHIVIELSREPSLSSSIKEFRLPENIMPIHQFVRLQPFLHGNSSIHGYTEISLKVSEATSDLILHMVDINTINDTIKLVSQSHPGEQILFTNHTYDSDRSFYKGKLAQNLTPGFYNLTMQFTGYLSDNLVGLYRTSYIDENSNSIPLAVSQFAAIDARRSFPCFDEPAMKSTFKIEIAREQNVHTLSNMPLQSIQTLDEQPGWFIDVFEQSVPMSSYLVAFVISDFVERNSTENDHVLFRVWTQEAALEEASYALDIGPEVLTYFEDYFELAFPLPKQDMVAIPDFFYGAMENWGLITYRGSRLLYSPIVSSASAKQRVCSIVSHELAHQWFGNLVTNKWWNDIWLNEGFATFIANSGCDFVEPSYGMFDQFFIEDFHVSLAVDSLETSHPLDFPIDHPEDIGRIYDTISYSKGASILHMIQNFITENSFRNGLVGYLKEFSYSNAAKDDLWRHLTNQSHIDGTLDASLTIKQLMDPWALQTGYPVLTVNRLDNGSVLLTQERFLLVKTNGSVDDSLWWLPLTYTSETEPDFTQTRVMQWMTNQQRTKVIDGFSTTSKWIVFNLQQNAYYRVNYDEDNWRALIQQLVHDHTQIHRLSRSQLLNDVYNLARAGLLSYDIALGINSYLNKETEYVPLYAALQELSYLKKMFQQEAGYSALQDYLLSLLTPLYDDVGFEDSLDDAHLTQLQRSLVTSWSCDLGLASCVQNSVQLYADWMASPNNYTIISPNLKETVYCTALSSGQESEWQFAFDQYTTTRFAAEQDILLEAMGCSQDETILLSYLNVTFTATGGIKKQDVSKVISSVSHNPMGEDLTWNYLNQNAQQIAAYMGSFSYVATYVSIASENFNTAEELQKLEQFKCDYSEQLGTSVQTIDGSIEKTKNNINWMQSYYEIILQWLLDNGYSY